MRCCCMDITTRLAITPVCALRSGRRVVAAFIATAFAQNDADAAKLHVKPNEIEEGAEALSTKALNKAHLSTICS